MNFWLIKSEANCYSIDDLKKDKRTLWTGIRNFQARNYMRDGMKKGDLVLFYHSIGTADMPAGSLWHCQSHWRSGDRSDVS